MRFILTFFASLLLAANFAMAETPQTVQTDDALSVPLGQSQTLRFKSAFQTINVVSEGILRASARTDHTVSLVGISPGETEVYVYGVDGQQLYSATVTVTPDPGHIVRLYGVPDVKDYVGYYCTSDFCGRADKELTGANGSQPPSQSISVTKNFPGGSVTKTKNY